MLGASNPLAELPAGAASRRLGVTATLLGTTSILFGLLLFAVLLHNGGQFAYTLDAPYTHMLLADQILQGNYGLNPGEPASPSSTIIYPFLLTLLSGLPLGPFAPLLVCLAATLAAVLLVFTVAREVGIKVDAIPLPKLAALTAAGLIAFNLVGLAFSGLEHSLHVTLTLMSLLGLLRFIRTRKAEWWWLIAIALLPLLRFEAMAALAADMLVLAVLGKWRHAAAAGLLGAAGVVAFGLFLHSLGLPWLPNSVLARSEVASRGLELGETVHRSLVVAVYANFRNNLVAYGGTLISLLIAASLVGLAHSSPLRRWLVPSIATSVAVGFFVVIAAAQMLGGSLTSFARYEIYVLVLGACAVLIAWVPEVNRAIETLRWPSCLGTCCVLLMLFAGYAFRTVDVVAASGNIHDQQYQMRRFVVDFWQRPYATNHPRLVAWRNPYPLLDLSGLDGHSAFAAQPQQPPAPGWPASLADRRGVGLAMLYEGTDPTPPASWIPIARLRLSGRVVTAIGSSVAFYATRPDQAAPLEAALKAFGPTLPPGAKLEAWSASMAPTSPAVPPRF